MSTVGDVVDRVLRSVQPPDDQPIRTTLASGLAAGATSLTYTTGLLGAEEDDLLGPGTIIEVNQEQIMVGTYASGTLSGLTRGVNGTTDATHASGDTITVYPTWARKDIFDAVCDTVVGLYPDLWQMKSSSFTLPARTDADPLTNAPSDLVEPLHFTYFSGATPKQVGVEFYRGLDTGTYSSGIGIDAPVAPASKAGTLYYRAKFARPDSESVDLVATTGLDASWERLIVVGATAQVLASRDLEQATQEFITEQFESQGFPVGRGQSLREGLLRYYEYLLERAQQGLRSESDTLVTYAGGIGRW